MSAVKSFAQQLIAVGTCAAEFTLATLVFGTQKETKTMNN
jgi:hypothetical protein